MSNANVWDWAVSGVKCLKSPQDIRKEKLLALKSRINELEDLKFRFRKAKNVLLVGDRISFETMDSDPPYYEGEKYIGELLEISDDVLPTKTTRGFKKYKIKLDNGPTIEVSENRPCEMVKVNNLTTQQDPDLYIY